MKLAPIHVNDPVRKGNLDDTANQDSAACTNSQRNMLSIDNFQDKTYCDWVQMRRIRNLPKKRSKLRNSDIDFLSTDASIVGNRDKKFKCA